MIGWRDGNDAGATRTPGSWVSELGSPDRGHLTLAERVSLLLGLVPAVGEGFRLALRARRGDRRNVDLTLLEPPDTPIVRASREYLESHSERAFINHGYRTAFWTVADLHQNGGLTPRDLETAWVASLLHDVGLEQPPEAGDFTLGGVEVVERLARSRGWSEEQTRDASEAIATNLCTRVNPAHLGMVAWAMNVGGARELGFPPHRAQLNPHRVSEIEARFPRDGFKESARQLISEEIRRVPDGRFAVLGPLFTLVMV